MDDRRLDTVPPQGPKRLYRSMDQKLFLGVCGGIGEYFDLDPTIVRVLFVVGTLLGGSTILLYIVLALIMPKEEDLVIHPREAAQHTLNEAGTEIQRGVNTVVGKVKEMTGRKPQDTTTGATAGQQWDGAAATGTMWTPPPATTAPTTSPDAPAEPISTAWETGSQSLSSDLVGEREDTTSSGNGQSGFGSGTGSGTPPA